jgi:hypothetical protein
MTSLFHGCPITFFYFFTLKNSWGTNNPPTSIHGKGPKNNKKTGMPLNYYTDCHSLFVTRNQELGRSALLNGVKLNEVCVLSVLKVTELRMVARAAGIRGLARAGRRADLLQALARATRAPFNSIYTYKVLLFCALCFHKRW